MHFCTARVMVAGDKDQVVYRDEYNPISWPEAELLRTIHGDDAVLDLKPFVQVAQSPREERARLVLRYGREYVDTAFGQGRGNAIEMEAGGVDIAYGKPWKNPLTQLEETVEEAPVLDATKFKPANGKGKPQEANL